MGDLFHWNVPSTWVEKVIWSADKAHKAHGHRFMILTKRVETMLHFMKTTTLPGDLRWLWMGITAENQQRYLERIRDLVTLRLVGLNCRLFVSCEPLLGPIALGVNYPRQLDLVIAGPETGPGKRPCNPEWIDDLKGQANAAGVPFVDKREKKTA
jgi:protein gp37